MDTPQKETFLCTVIIRLEMQIKVKKKCFQQYLGKIMKILALMTALLKYRNQEKVQQESLCGENLT